MAGPYGVVPEGFRRKLLTEILDELEADQRASVSAKINTSPAGPHGQLNATYAREFALGWEVLEAAYNSTDPDKAEGDALDALCKLTGTTRPGATFGEVLLECDLTSGTTLLSGVHFAAVDGEPDNRWTPKADFTAPTTAVHEVLFRAENRGTFFANEETISVIVTPVSGWNAVNNEEDAEEGREPAEDPELRALREADVNRSGSTSAKAIATDLRNILVDGDKPVISATVIENDTDIPGINNLPPHTIEPVIHDSPAVDNNVIAQTVWDNKAGGIGTQGLEFGLAVIDEEGTTKQVNFSRFQVQEVYLDYDLTTTTGYVGDTAFKQAVVDFMRGHIKGGTDVLRWVCEQAAKQEGVVNALCKLSFSPSPTLSADLPIGDREIADFDTSRITI